MSTQLKQLRRRPKYNHSDSPIVAVIYALARDYHCSVLERRGGIAIRYQGRAMRLGTVAEIKAMTIRGLIGIFEESTQEWRYEIHSGRLPESLRERNAKDDTASSTGNESREQSNH